MKNFFAYLIACSATFLLVDQALPQPLASDFSVATPSTKYVCRYNEVQELELFARASERNGLWDLIDYNLELNSVKKKRRKWKRNFGSRLARLGKSAFKTRQAKRRWKSYKRTLRALKQCGRSLGPILASDPCLEIAPSVRMNGTVRKEAFQEGHSIQFDTAPLEDDSLSLRIINGNRCNRDNTSVVELELVFSFSSGGCSGTLLDEHTILTAAHCVESRPRKIRVYAGSQIIEADSYIIHPDYNPFSFFSIESFDVALIKTLTPIAAPISKLMQGAANTGETAIIAGYGIDEQGGAGRLKAASLEVSFVDFDTIATRYDGRSNNANTCFGDSGGPLFVSRQGEWVVAGIVSNGDLQSCGVGDVSRYTNINNPAVRSFIETYRGTPHLGIY